MKIHEHQAKDLFRKYGIPVPSGEVAYSVEEAVENAKRLSPSGPWVVKAQIHAGGRGKAGGVKFSKTLNDLKTNALQILGKRLFTPQTGSEGKEVKRILIDVACEIQRELYLAITLDREAVSSVVMGSEAGGMDIEEVAKISPEKIFKEHIQPSVGLRDFQTKNLAFNLGLGSFSKEFSSLLKNLFRLYIDYDCTLVEINPLVVTKQNQLIAIDAKVTFDENALFRHPQLNELVDPNEEDPQEQAAKKYDLSYISLDGNIGCMVNGAGLAMATMDIIKLEGGEPANFLDVGGGANEEKVREAFKIILKDPKVKAILVNIFGGIMKCDVIALGILAAAKDLKINVPLVVRLEGTNVDLGKSILKDSGLKIISVTGMHEAAQRVVEATRN